MPPSFIPTANAPVQMKLHGTDGGKWEKDYKHGGQKRVPKDANKPKQKWVQGEEKGKWKQVSKDGSEKEAIAPIPLPEKYKDEDKKEGWRAGTREDLKDTTKTVTKYFNPQEQQENMLTPNGANNLTTSDGSFADFARPKTYAMSKDGEIGAHETKWLEANDAIPGNKQQSVHHSSIFAGDDVAHAGHISAKNGKINYLDDDSGHYRPDEKHTYAAYKKMKKQGILDENGKIKLVNKEAEDKMNQAEWNANQVNLPFSAYGQTKGNEKQIRNKMSMLDELKESSKVGEDENVIPAPLVAHQPLNEANPQSFDNNWFEIAEESEEADEEWFYNPSTGQMELRQKQDDGFDSEYESDDGEGTMFYNPETHEFEY